MRVNTEKKQYSSDIEEYFGEEIDLLNDQFNENEKLYEEVHKGMDRNLERLDNKAMFGSSSPYRDIAELGKVLNDVRSNQVQIIKERTNEKKTVKDLELRRENMKKDEKNSTNAELLMKDLISELTRQKPEITKSTVAERNNNKGMEKLNNLNPDELGLNENDFRMIEKFKTTTPGGN
jgi:hypothetical protein